MCDIVLSSSGKERDDVTEIVTGTEIAIVSVIERGTVIETVTMIVSERASGSKRNRTGTIRLTRTSTQWMATIWTW